MDPMDPMVLQQKLARLTEAHRQQEVEAHSPAPKRPARRDEGGEVEDVHLLGAFLGQTGCVSHVC